jgi:chromosome segregation ATPase
LKTPARLALLLVVHQRRIDRALATVQHCNERLQGAESERARRRQHLLDTQAQRARELARHTEVIGTGPQRAFSATELAAARNRLEWWGARVEERSKELAAAEATLAEAHSEAQRARLRYRQVQAKQQGLTHLLDERQHAMARERAGREERDSDGRWGATTLQAACTVESKLG